jgi:hypothetical protein
MSNPNEPNVSSDWDVGAEDAALLDAFESGGFGALQEAEEMDAKANEELVANAVNDLVSENLPESEEPVEEAESNLDEDEEAVESGNEESSESTDEEEEAEFFFVDGPRGKKIQVPLKPDQDTLAKMAQAADRAKLFQSQLDKQKHEMETLQSDMEVYKEESDLFRKLEELSDDLDVSDPSTFNKVIRVMTNDEIDMDALIDAAIAERDELIEMTDDQIAVVEKVKELRRREREIKKQELRHERERERAAAEDQRASQRAQRDMINNALLKHDVRGKLGDQARENGIMERAWHESLRKMTAVDGSGNPIYGKLTPEIVEEIIKGEIQFFAGPSKAEVTKQVDKAVKRKRASSTKKVQDAIAPNRGGMRKQITSRAQLEEMDLDDVFANLDSLDLDF